jgi:hypothetical protein
LQEAYAQGGEVEPLEPKEDRRKLYLEFAHRNAMQQDFDPEYGRVIYTLSEREKIKNHIVLDEREPCAGL